MYLRTYKRIYIQNLLFHLLITDTAFYRSGKKHQISYVLFFQPIEIYLLSFNDQELFTKKYLITHTSMMKSGDCSEG